jgi:hypothetical protein
MRPIKGEHLHVYLDGIVLKADEVHVASTAKRMAQADWRS